MLAYCFFILSQGPLKVPVPVKCPLCSLLPAQTTPQCSYLGCIWELSAELCRNKHSHLDIRGVKKSTRAGAWQRAAQVSNVIWLMKGSVFEVDSWLWVPSFIPLHLPPRPAPSDVEAPRPRPDLWKGLHQFSLYTSGIR